MRFEFDVRVHVPGWGVLVAQIDDLRAAVGDVSREVSEQGQAVLDAVARVEAKIAELGEPDPDLSAEVAALRESAEALQSSQESLAGLAGDEPPAEPPPVDPNA